MDEGANAPNVSAQTIDPSEAAYAEKIAKVKGILSGETSIRLTLQFLYSHNRSDLLILKTIKQSVEMRNSVCHSATICTNAIMHAGTTVDTFLRENLEWLSRATNWAKFSSTASLGVIHRGHLQQVVEIPSDSSLAETVEILSKNKILSALVRNVEAPEDASWMDRYIGIVEFAGIVVWLLHQVGDISGSFRWGPFLALQNSDSFLIMLLLLSQYRMKSLPVVDLGEGRIENIITQSSVVHMLAECVGLSWFENWGTKKLFELRLPIMKPDRLVKLIWKILKHEESSNGFKGAAD